MSTHTIPTLETARLRLRPFCPEDADAYHVAIWSDPDVTRYLPGREPRPRAAVDDLLARTALQWQLKELGLWAVEWRDEPALIGHCGLSTMPDSAEVEVAYALARSVWGRGIATEAARACLRYGFESVGLARIVAVAVPANVASQQVMRKLGMQYEGILPAYGTELATYSMTADAFNPGDAPYAVLP